MSSIISTYKNDKKPVPMSAYFKLIINTGIAMVIGILLLSTVGCSTTPTFKPTASVMVGAHKSL